jgi:hypothetical protein
MVRSNSDLSSEQHTLLLQENKELTNALCACQVSKIPVWARVAGFFLIQYTEMLAFVLTPCHNSKTNAAKQMILYCFK